MTIQHIENGEEGLSVRTKLNQAIDIVNDFDSKQDVLVSGENISTVNGESLLDGTDITDQVIMFDESGEISKSRKVRKWIGQVVSDSLGEFSVDWSSAGFISPPDNVQVTAVSEIGVVGDRAWATLANNSTAMGGEGYTLKGNGQIAENITVYVEATKVDS